MVVVGVVGLVVYGVFECCVVVCYYFGLDWVLYVG